MAPLRIFFFFISCRTVSAFAFCISKEINDMCHMGLDYALTCKSCAIKQR